MTLSIIALFLAVIIVGICVLYAKVSHLDRFIINLAHALNRRSDVQEIALKAIAGVLPSLIGLFTKPYVPAGEVPKGAQGVSHTP